MKTIINRQTEIPIHVQKAATLLFPTCEDWLIKRYRLDESFFENFTLTLSCTKGRNWYFPDKKTGLIRVASVRLYLYDIVEAEYTTPIEGLDVGVGDYLCLSFIHEATHYIQDLLGKPSSELETTVNQLDFMYDFCPIICKLLVEATGKLEEIETI